MAIKPRHTDKFNALEPKKTFMQRAYPIHTVMFILEITQT